MSVQVVGLSRSAVHQRIQRLERDGIIMGYTALTQHATGDEPVAAIVLINLVTQRYGDVASTLAGWPEIRSCCPGGRHDRRLGR